MKKRRIAIVYVLMLIVLSIVMSYIFIVQGSYVNKVDVNQNNMKINVGHLILYESKQADESYHYLSFSKGVSKKKKAKYNALMENLMSDYTSRLCRNHDLYYVVKDKKQVVIDRHGKPFKNKSLNMTLTYKKGKVSGDYKDLYTTFNKSFIDLYAGRGYTTDVLGKKIESLEKAMENGEVKINTPKNMSIMIQMPKTLSTSYMRDLLNQSAHVSNFEFAMLVTSLIVLLFIFCVPLNVMEDIEPFKSVKNWYFLINAFLIFLGAYFSVSTISEVNESYFSMYSDQILSFTFFNVSLSNKSLALIVLTFALILFYFMISLSAFGLKYIIKNISTYFKDHTFIGTFAKHVKNVTNVYAKEIFDDHHTTALCKMIFLQLACFMLLTFVVYVIFEFILGDSASPYSLFIWIIVMILYGWYLVKFYTKKIYEMKAQYQVLVDQAQDLSNGNFSEVHEDLGAFNTLRDEMNHVKDGFEAAVSEEVKSTTMKTELISNVSHDLKTPLTCIKNYVILLKDAKTKEDMQEYTTQIENYTNRLSSLIEDLFEVSKVNSGNVTLHTTSLDLLALLNQAIVENEEKLEKKNLKVIRSSDLETAMCELDGEKTYRVLDNLLGNIAKYALSNTRVYIDVTHDEKTVSIALKNISEAQMNFTSEEIVERFVRGDKSRHVAGSGLGLAIAKSFTEVMGGTFELTIDGDMFKVILTFPLENNFENS